ncbi:MAG: hypothetical protein HY763_16900 [Planctomycetes bacterium]|nr:hypothetical protein [Planctomycetota bacterium]
MRRWKRIVLEPETWSGEDIFIARGCSAIITSERFRDFVERHKLLNIVLVPAEEYDYDFYR